MVARHAGLLKRWWRPGLAVVLLVVLTVAWVLSQLSHDEVSATVTIPTYGALKVRVDTGTRQFEVKRPHATMHVLGDELQTSGNSWLFIREGLEQPEPAEEHTLQAPDGLLAGILAWDDADLRLWLRRGQALEIGRSPPVAIVVETVGEPPDPLSPATTFAHVAIYSTSGIPNPVTVNGQSAGTLAPVSWDPDAPSFVWPFDPVDGGSHNQAVGLPRSETTSEPTWVAATGREAKTSLQLGPDVTVRINGRGPTAMAGHVTVNNGEPRAIGGDDEILLATPDVDSSPFLDAAALSSDPDMGVTLHGRFSRLEVGGEDLRPSLLPINAGPGLWFGIFLAAFISFFVGWLLTPDRSR